MTRRYVLIAATRAAAPGVVAGATRLAEVDPDVPRTLVVVDGDEVSIAALEGLGELRTGADLGITPDEVGRWAAAYGAGGIMWAAFPHVLRAVGSPGERVLWLGADLEVVRPPEALWSALGASSVVAGSAAPSLAPHGHEAPDASNGQPRALQPVSAVVKHDGELVARSLLGWTAGDATAERVLASWPVPREHPSHEAVANAEVAQVWFNALALRPEVEILDDRGLVLSVAQLLDREVADGPTVDGQPLTLLALRGFDAQRPHLLEGKVLTARLSERPALAPVLARRAEALLDAGWTPVAQGEEPVTPWSAYDAGLPNSELVRDVARAGIRAGAVTRSPFAEEGWAQLSAWMTGKARVGGSIGVNRLLAAVHAARPDLHAAYPSLDGPDGLGFLGWAWVYGRDELSIPEALLPPRPAFLDAAPAEPEPHGAVADTPGVNLAGYFTSELGLGESARQIASALETAGVSTTPVQGLLVPPTRQQAEFVPVGPKDAHHDVNVVVVNGDQMPAFARDVGEGFFQDRPTVGVWWWEVDPFPIEDWGASLQWLDEVWVGTDFIRSLVEPHVDVPVWVFPVPVSVARLEEPLERSHFGFADDETVFLYVWDYHSTEARKNPSGLVEAYKRAFPDGSPHKTRLVLKCINHENLPEADEKVRLAAAGRPDITFIDRFLSGREKNGLLELCDCYVSPHRSEGFGYTPAEAMLLGKPVIVTAYGGTTEYTDDTVARMVPYSLTTVGPGALPYPPDGRWAEPDLDALADALRWIVEAPDEAEQMARRGHARVAEQHALERCGRLMAGRIDEIRRRHATAPTAAPGASDAPPPAHHRRTLGSAARGAARRLPASTQLRRGWWRMQDRAVASRTADLRERIDALGGDAADRDAVVRSIDERLRTDIATLTTELQRTQALLTKKLTLVDGATKALDPRVTSLEERLADHLSRHESQPWIAAEAGVDLEQHGPLGRALVARANAGTGDSYADFLAMFRGPYERVLELMAPYGEVLRSQGPLLDIGCGRGELLDVAGSVGTQAHGVDLDAELVRQAVERGHSAEAGDGLAALARTADASLGAVSAIHVIEHLEVDALSTLFSEALRALRPGGILLAETINPYELSAATTFWVDPTHRGPVFPQVAMALALSVGFGEVAVYAPDGTGDWEADRLTSTRYAVLARR